MSNKLRRANLEKLRTAARMAMSHKVLLCLDVDELKTLSLHEAAMWHTDRKAKVSMFRALYQELGTFEAMPGENVAQVFERMWEEAAFAQAALGPKPPPGWIGC